MRHTLTFAVSLLVVLLSYQNCAPVHVPGVVQSDNSSQNFTFSEAQSKTAFSEKFHSIVRTNCSNCHATNQEPFFASLVPSDSFDVIKTKNLVDLSNISNSKLVLKIDSGHNSINKSVASDLEQGLTAWINRAQEIADQESANVNSATDDLSLFSKTLYPELTKNCATCHGFNQPPLFAVNTASAAFNALNSAQLVKLDQANNSKIVLKIRNGHRSFQASLADILASKIQSWSDQRP